MIHRALVLCVIIGPSCSVVVIELTDHEGSDDYTTIGKISERTFEMLLSISKVLSIIWLLVHIEKVFF